MENQVAFEVLKKCGVITQVAHYFVDAKDSKKLAELMKNGLSVDARKNGISIIDKVIKSNDDKLWNALFDKKKVECANSIDGLNAAIKYGAKEKFKAMLLELESKQVAKILRKNAYAWMRDDEKNRWAILECHKKSGLSFIKALPGREMHYLHKVAKKMESVWFVELLEHMKSKNWDFQTEYTHVAELLLNKDYSSINMLMESGYQMNGMSELIKALQLNLDIQEIEWLVNKMPSVFVQEDGWGNLKDIKTSQEVDKIIDYMRVHAEKSIASQHNPYIGTVHADTHYLSAMAGLADDMRRWDMALDFAIKIGRSDVAETLIKRGRSPARLIEANKVHEKMASSSNVEIERCLLVIASASNKKPICSVAL